MKNRKVLLAELITGLCLTFDKDYSQQLVDIWEKALGEFTTDQIAAAVDRWVKSLGKRFPVPSDIRDVIVGDPASNAALGLETLKTAMSRSGSYLSVRFSDPALMVTVEHYGGWPEVCAEWVNLRDQDISYWEHNFKLVYQAAFRSGRKPTGKYLSGLHERHNVSNAGSFKRGLIPEPVVDVFGPDQRCVRVPLAQIEPKAALVGLAKKQLESKDEAEEVVETTLTTGGQ